MWHLKMAYRRYLSGAILEKSSFRHETTTAQTWKKLSFDSSSGFTD
jgi:hypothetical protein